MKIWKIVFMIIALSYGHTVLGQKLRSSDVPKALITSFKKLYPEVAKVTWAKEGGNFEAGFRQGSTKMSAVFNADGNQLEYESAIPKSSLPVQSIAYLKEHYQGVVIKEVAKITKANGDITYEAEVKGKDVLFDSKGHYLKIAKD